MLGEPTDGGRVTEICARPLINLFYPELAGLAQPLAGEQACRRSLLQRMPFFTGYAVELGLLIDSSGARRPDALAQVDLGEPAHVDQPTHRPRRDGVRNPACGGPAPCSATAGCPRSLAEAATPPRPERANGGWAMTTPPIPPRPGPNAAPMREFAGDRRPVTPEGALLLHRPGQHPAGPGGSLLRTGDRTCRPTPASERSRPSMPPACRSCSSSGRSRLRLETIGRLLGAHSVLRRARGVGCRIPDGTGQQCPRRRLEQTGNRRRTRSPANHPWRSIPVRFGAVKAVTACAASRARYGGWVPNTAAVPCGSPTMAASDPGEVHVFHVLPTAASKAASVAAAPDRSWLRRLRPASRSAIPVRTMAMVAELSARSRWSATGPTPTSVLRHGHAGSPLDGARVLDGDHRAAPGAVPHSRRLCDGARPPAT